MPKCVVFSERAFTSILVETQEKIRTETGGVFLGYRKGDVWYVIESIDPGPNSVFQPAYFEYDQDYINHLINKVSRLYSLQLDLIGLWHRHPGSYDSFSGTDDGTNTKYAELNEQGAISTLVNIDPQFRLTVYTVTLPLKYEKIKYVVGDSYIPQEMLTLRNSAYLQQQMEVRDTKYQQDQFGNYILNEYGMRSKEPCHYSQEKKYIAMHDEMTDAEYADVIQHELGHFIDDILGRPSTGNVFRQAFSDVASRYNVDTLEGRRLLNDMLDDAFSTGAAFDRNITDIISALTMNHPTVVNRFNDEDVAYYRHKDGYWNRRNENGTNAGMREKDSFANVFAIETGNYRISTNFVERWFPELSIALRQSVEGA